MIAISTANPVVEADFDLSASRLCGTSTLIPIDREHPWRRDLEMFIADQYRAIFDAQPQEFPHLLLSQRNENRNWIAGIGLRNAQNESLLLEHYLGEPVEQSLSRRMGRNIARRDVVELGSFAISDWRNLRRIFTEVSFWCLRLGYRWITCTATCHLDRLFRSYGIKPQFLAHASQEQFPDDASNWGRYYQSAPRVLVAPVSECCAKLGRRNREGLKSP